MHTGVLKGGSRGQILFVHVIARYGNPDPASQFRDYLFIEVFVQFTGLLVANMVRKLKASQNPESCRTLSLEPKIVSKNLV
jgi:hypothetical protein